MSKLVDIQINPFQLNRLLNERQWQGYHYLLERGVYCSTCEGSPAKGIKVSEIFLTNLNDILVRGTCNVCGGKVARVLEFGEDEAFFEKANVFRDSLKEL